MSVAASRSYLPIRGRVFLAVAVAAAMLFSADAADATSPVENARVVLGFGESYGSGSVHRGIDLGAASGEMVRAAAAGTVSFVGAVPADGGGTAIAATIDVADGTKVTVLPLSGARVKRGSVVAEGDTLGALAEAGDGSSATPHVHLSLRRGSVYLDPSVLLVTRPPDSTGESHPGAAEAPAGSASDAPRTASPGAGGSALPSRGEAAAQVPASAKTAGLPSGVTLAPEQGQAAVVAPLRPEAAPSQQVGVLTPEARLGAARAASAGPVSSHTAVRGVDVSGLADRLGASASRYARRHIRALATGVAALLVGVAALTPLGIRAGSGGAVRSVRPEGEAVAAAAGR